MQFDLVFEGGGAKGAVFVGAMQAFEEAGHTVGRTLGTSAGAISAVLLAAGYSAAEMQEALTECDDEGRPVFESFMGKPTPPTEEEVRASGVRQMLADLDIPLLPEFLERPLDDLLARMACLPGVPSHLYSLVEHGGWFSAAAFVTWLRRRLDTGTFRGQPRRFGACTLAEFHQHTGCFVSFVASNTSSQSLAVLNHMTAPDLPVVHAVRASMGIPLVWPEVVWRAEWGTYLGRDITGQLLVDGGVLSNFAIELLVSDAPQVTHVMGPHPHEAGVIGFLIDEQLEVPGEPAPAPAAAGLGRLQTVRRIARLLNTMMEAHDKMVIESVADRVVRLPAKGYGTTEFGLSGERQARLVEASRAVTAAFLHDLEVLEDVPVSFGGSAAADELALRMLGM